MSTGSWGSADAPLLPRVLRWYFDGRPCPDEVLDDGTLDMLDGEQLKPIGMDWPKAATESVVRMVAEAFEMSPELLEASVWSGDDHRDQLLSELPIATRGRNCLRRASLVSVRDLQRLTWGDLTLIRNLGVRTLLDILCALEVLGGRAETRAEVDQGRTRHVLEIWSEIAQIELSAELTARFHHEAFGLLLASWPEDELRASGSRVHGLRAQLRLVEWADELACPGTVILATIPARWSDNRDEEAETLREALTELLTHEVDDREFEVVSQSYGLGGADARTLSEIGIFLGFSGAWIGQIRDKALRKALVRADNSPLSRALVGALRDLVGDSDPDAVNILDVALSVLPATPVRTSVDLIARLLGRSSEERGQLRKSLRAQLRKAAREQRRDAARLLRLGKSQVAAGERFAALRAEAFWPESVAETEPAAVPVPMRLTGEDLPPYTFASDKMRREIAAESTLELGFFHLCEKSPDVVWYCEQPLVVDYYFDSRWRSYYPDAIVAFDDGTRLLVEVKNLTESALSMNQAKWSAARSWCANNGLGFLVTDGRRTLRSVEHHQPDPEHVQILADYLKAGPIAWLDLLDLRREVGFSTLDLTAAALHRGWDYRLAPWRLSLPDGSQSSSLS